MTFPLLYALFATAPVQRPAHFRTDVIVALSHAGCNSGARHGPPQGNGAFRLSLRGHDPGLGLFTLPKGDFGRRVDTARPERSLFLLKGTGRTAHGGGVRLKPGSLAHDLLLRWVAEGCRDDGPAALVRL